MPDSRRVLRERPVDPALECIGEKRVGKVLWAFWGGDAKGSETNRIVDLTRRYVGRRIGPIPVWGAERKGSLDPGIGVGLVLLCDFKRSGLETLLHVKYCQYGIYGVMAILTSYKAR
jgi:hypothetical protein